MNKEEFSVYKYIIDVLTKINLYKMHQAFGDDKDYLGEIVDNSRELLDNFPKLDVLNPYANIGLEIRLILKCEDKYLLQKDSKNKLNLIKIKPALEGSIDKSVVEYIKTFYEDFDEKDLKLKTFINLLEFMDEESKSKITKPIYSVVYEANLEKAKINRTKMKKYFINLYEINDDLNQIDKRILEEN